MTYADKLKDPRWQKKRLLILQRDEWTCQKCFDTDSPLAVHHLQYTQGCDPWDYPDSLLLTLCQDCHEKETHDRPNAEVDLLDALRPAFLADDIKSIAMGFRHMRLTRTHEVIASMLEWFLSNSPVQEDMLQRYDFACRIKLCPIHRRSVVAAILRSAQFDILRPDASTVLLLFYNPIHVRALRQSPSILSEVLSFCFEASDPGKTITVTCLEEWEPTVKAKADTDV